MQLGFVLERAISGWAVAALPLAKNTGLAHTFSTAAARQRVKLILTGVILAVSMLLVGFGGVSGWAMLGRGPGRAVAVRSRLPAGLRGHHRGPGRVVFAAV